MGADLLQSSLIAELSAAPSGRMEFLRTVQAWLRTNANSFGAALRERWLLDELAELDLGRYPIDQASLDPREELERLRALQASSKEILAMRLRDILWAGVTVESDVTCPRCGGASLRVLEDRAGATVLSCDLCAWSQDPTGRPWHDEHRLRPARSARS